MSQPEMTPWFMPEIKPVRVGEYNASKAKFPKAKRWWDGRRWSLLYLDHDQPSMKAAARAIPEPPGEHIYWRGLATDPGANHDK